MVSLGLTVSLLGSTTGTKCGCTLAVNWTVTAALWNPIPKAHPHLQQQWVATLSYVIWQIAGSVAPTFFIRICVVLARTKTSRANTQRSAKISFEFSFGFSFE
jgi:hypothetical protein